MDPSENSESLPVNAGLWPNSRAPQRAKLHGDAWQRDGFGALNSMNSTRRRQRLTGQQSDIEGPSVAGLSAMRPPGTTRRELVLVTMSPATTSGTTFVPIGGLAVLGYSLQQYFG